MVRRVLYPSLTTHPDHDLAARLLSGFGGVLSFEVVGGEEQACRVIDGVKRFKRAASLGGVSSLITWPAGVTHVGLSEAERQAAGVTSGLLRLALGVEPAEELYADLMDALERSI
jgi:cystathionine beta-lyase/cystathionine gamma-synthase